MLLQAATAQRVKQVRLFFGLISLLISEQKKKTALERRWCRWEAATATLCEAAVRHPLPAPCRARGVTVTEVPLAAAQWCSSSRNQSWVTATPQRPLGMASELCVCVCVCVLCACTHLCTRRAAAFQGGGGTGAS